MEMPALEGIKLQGGPFLGAFGKPGATTVGEPGVGAVGDFSADGDVVPLTRIAPRYPRKAALKGIEGWVKVEFTVLEDGSVADPVVLDAKPGRIFNRAAIKAILRWKFRPKLVDGKPVKRRASQTISFKLDKQ
jgi:protein TonB